MSEINKEVLITNDMLEAGVEALNRFQENWPSEELVRQVFVAMMLSMPKEKLQGEAEGDLDRRTTRRHFTSGQAAGGSKGPTV